MKLLYYLNIVPLYNYDTTSINIATTTTTTIITTTAHLAATMEEVLHHLEERRVLGVGDVLQPFGDLVSLEVPLPSPLLLVGAGGCGGGGGRGYYSPQHAALSLHPRLHHRPHRRCPDSKHPERKKNTNTIKRPK